MDVQLTDEQRSIRSFVREFATAELEPVAAAYDESREFPWDNVRKMADVGCMAMAITGEYGGSGTDYVSYALAVEEVSRACASSGIIMSANNSLVWRGLSEYGTHEQKERFLRPLTDGTTVGAFGLTEPNAGSDAGHLSTTAVRDGDGWVLNGTKVFITNGGVAAVILIMAVTDKSQKSKGITAFVVEKSSPGFSVGTREKTLGIRASNTSELILEDCRIPPENQLSPMNRGYRFEAVKQRIDDGRGTTYGET